MAKIIPKSKITHSQINFEDFFIHLLSPVLMGALKHFNSKENRISNLILNTHLIIEQVLTKIIIEKFHLRGTLEIKKLSYQNKLDFLYSINLISKDNYQNFIELGEVRNRYAHRLGHEEDIDKLKISVTKTFGGLKDLKPCQLEGNPKKPKDINYEKAKVYCTWLTLSLYLLVDDLCGQGEISFDENSLLKELNLPRHEKKEIQDKINLFNKK